MKNNLIPKPVKEITAQEWKFAFLIGLLGVVITSSPLIFGYIFSPPGKVYDGLQALITNDFQVYYSYINQAIEGEYFFKNNFTTETQFLRTFNIWWLLVGVGAKFFSLSPIVAFQISRVLMIIIFSFIGYYFFSYFFSDILKRKLAHIFLFFSAGLGFYFAPLLYKFDKIETAYFRWPIDLWQPEAITFNALWLSSHFIASISFTMILILLIYHGLKSGNLKMAWLAGFLALFYFNFHPYYFPPIYGVLFFYLMYLVWQQKRIQSRWLAWCLIFILISSPSIIYHLWLIFSDPIIFKRASQNITDHPSWPHIFIGYGFLFLGFIGGLWQKIFHKRLENKHIFMLIWLAINIVLIILPTQFNRRYVFGLHIIFVFFTIDFLVYLYQVIKNKWPIFYKKIVSRNYLLFGILFVLIFGMTNFLNIFRTIYYLQISPENTGDVYFLEKGLFDSYRWLKDQPRNRIIFAYEIPASFVPGLSGQAIYYGHNHETLFYDKKKKDIFTFFASNSVADDRYKKDFLRREKIDYVIYSSYERSLGDFKPQEKDYLRPVFTSGQTTIYEVLP